MSALGDREGEGMRKSRDAVLCCLTSPRWARKGLSSLGSGLWFVLRTTGYEVPTFLPAAPLGLPHFATNGTRVTRRHGQRGEEVLPPRRGTWLVQELSGGWSTTTEAAPFSSGTREGWGHFIESQNSIHPKRGGYIFLNPPVPLLSGQASAP